MSLRYYSFVGFLLLASRLAHSQQGAGSTFLVNQEIRVSGLPVRTASSIDPAAILSAALETIFHDSDVCCGKNSALQSAALAADPLSLNDLARKIEGEYILGDGRRITIRAEYVPPSAITPSKILAPLKRHQASLVAWKSRLYVLYGAVFDEVRDSAFQIHRLLLLDTRYSDGRRETSLDREGNAQTDLQGILILTFGPE